MRQVSAAVILLMVFVLVTGVISGCGTTPLNTRAVEEKYLDEGHANRMYEYGEELLAQGRYQQAHAAFLDAEMTAYTNTLRNAARKRRIWLEDSIAKMEKGGKPIPPTAELGETVDLPEPSLPLKGQTGSGTPGQQILPGLKPGSPAIVIPGPAPFPGTKASDEDEEESLD